MELMESTSPSSYNAVLELDKKLRDLSAAINVYEGEQLNAAAATLEWSCILGANVRQAGECFYACFNSRLRRRFRSLYTSMWRGRCSYFRVAISIATSYRIR